MQRLIKQEMPGKRAMSGMTIIEMLIVTSIMAILLALAIPSFNSTMRDNRVLTATNSFAATIAGARSEAVKRGRMVAICPSVDPYITCSGTNWADGWIIYLVANTATATTAPIDTTVAELPNGIISTGSALPNVAITKVGNANAFVRFSPRGISDEAFNMDFRPADGSGSSSSTCSSSEVNFLQLQVGLVGRTSVVKLPCV